MAQKHKSGPTIPEEERRDRGQWRLSVRIPEQYKKKLDTICDASGYTYAEQITGMIDAEIDELEQFRSVRKSTQGS